MSLCQQEVDLGPAGSQSRQEFWDSVQPRYGSGANHPARDHIAVPMHVADGAAFSEIAASGKNFVSTTWNQFGEDQRPSPPYSGMARWVGSILSQLGLVFRCAYWRILDHKRAASLIGVFCRIGRKPNVGQAPPQQ